jgi:hypothetical protein
VLALTIATTSSAEPLRVGGVLGFGVTAVRSPGAFRWDFDSTHEDTLLAAVKLSAGIEGLRGFVSLGARLDGSAPGQPEFELREASLRSAWRRGVAAGSDSLVRAIRGDSAALRLFARQPGALWVESGFAPPILTAASGGEDVLGGRFDGAWKRLVTTVLVADRGGIGPRFEPPGDAPRAAAATGDVVVLRLRGDAISDGGLRIGATWKRWRPDDAFVIGTEPDAAARDVWSADARAAWRGIETTVEFAQSSDAFAAGAVAGPGLSPELEHGWQSTWSGRLTDVLPTNATLRAELRSPGLGLGRYGTLGFAPQYRALGSTYVDRLVEAEPDAGMPRRGLEGYRLEAWYTLPFWPVRLLQIYDRHQQFRDADRRVLLQTTECQAWIQSGIRGRLFYVQRDERWTSRGVHEHHDQLIGELAAEDPRARARLQAGFVDLGAAHERTVLALESAAHIGTRVQGLLRLCVASEGGRARRAFWFEMQYWHLPGFELALQYGPEWIGDGSDPALDSDLTADGNDVDRIRLHFRGWF